MHGWPSATLCWRSKAASARVSERYVAHGPTWVNSIDKPNKGIRYMQEKPSQGTWGVPGDLLVVCFFLRWVFGVFPGQLIPLSNPRIVHFRPAARYMNDLRASLSSERGNFPDSTDARFAFK